MQDDLTLDAYHYELPEQQIAQSPADRRDQSRLLVLDRTSGSITHAGFADIVGLFSPGDLLVANDTKVFPARLFGLKDTGGKAEVFLLNYPAPTGEIDGAALFDCEALIKSSRRPRVGSSILIGQLCRCRVEEDLGRGKWRLVLSVPDGMSLDVLLAASGEVPLPPYIKRNGGPTATDTDRYQTVYASRPGAVAAPTAGLHFTDELIERLRQKGVQLAFITLHVGYGTFAPVETADIREHRIHREIIDIPATTADLVNETKRRGGKVWAAGTTSVRALEFASTADGLTQPTTGWCDLYITPGFRFKVVDNLITNFHLPQSSLMFLVSALCGRETLLACYAEAIERGYRFYSYGDAMAVIG